MLVSEKAAEREALVALERFVKAMDAVGPASVRMCYVVQYVCMKYYIITFETGECSLAAHLVLEFHPTGKCVGRRVILFHMFCERKQIVLIFVGSFAFFFLLLTDDIREHHLYPVIDCWWKENKQETREDHVAIYKYFYGRMSREPTVTFLVVSLPPRFSFALVFLDIMIIMIDIRRLVTCVGWRRRQCSY
jgi:hypothetical protein